MSNQDLRNIGLDCIVPSKDNARKIDRESGGFKELLNSIRAGGVRVPIHLRPHPTRKGKYEIRAGERRWRACKSLGLKTIPAIVHQKMDDAAALDLTYIENKFREDLKPLEEVAEIGRCMERLGGDAKLIASRIGKTEKWVRLRANIHKNLHQSWRQAFLDLEKNRDFELWTVTHLTLIARLPGNIQKDIMEEARRFYGWIKISVSELERRIADKLHLLSKAKWGIDDETLLPKAGACSKCVKRSGHQPLLWYSESIKDQIKAKDRCLDSYCWENKLKAWLGRRAKELSGKHPDLIYIAKGGTSYNDDERLSKTFGRVLGEHNVDKSTRGTKGSVPAMVVSGKGMGTVIYVRERRTIRSAGGRAAGKPTPLKVRMALLKAKRWGQVLIELREKVAATGVDKISYKNKKTGVMALVAVYGNESAWSSNVATCQKEIKRLLDHNSKNPTAAYSEALISLWESFKPTLDRILTYGGPVTQTPGHTIEEAGWIAKLIGADIDKMLAEVSKQKGFGEPKSWKGLNADGTPKTKKAKRSATAKKKE